MDRFTLRTMFGTAVASFALAASVPAGAGKTVSVTVQTQFQAPLQILGADHVCSGWTAGTDPTTGGPTLTCVPVASTGAPAGCSGTVNETTSASLPNGGGSVNLAASCTSPSTGITYSWTKNGVSGNNGASWTDTLPANTSVTIASTTSYQVSACVGTACVTVPQTPLTVTVSAAPAPSGAPAGCVATINGSTSATLASSGGSVSLAASCSSPSSGVTYNWIRNGASASNSANWTDTPPANTSTTSTSTTSYQVQACNGGACVTVPQTSLTAVRAVADPPPTAWNGTCPGFDGTRLIVLDWNHANQRMLTSQVGGFGPRDVVVVQFTTGGISSTNNLPNIAAVEYGTSPSARTAVLSAKPCDFEQQATPGAMIVGNTVTAVFAVGAGSGFGFYPVLQTNTTYYLNVKNNPNSGCWATGMCDMAFALSKSTGL